MGIYREFTTESQKEVFLFLGKKEIFRFLAKKGNIPKDQTPQLNTKAITDEFGLVDNWFDGLLTIGTFGFDTLKFQDNDDDECEIDVDLDGSIINDDFVDQELDPLLISNENKLYDHHHHFRVLDSTDNFESTKTVEMPAVSATVEVEQKAKKKRITLAELLMEDRTEDDDKCHEKKQKNPNLDEKVKNWKQKGTKLSSTFLFGKKKMIMTESKDGEEEDLRPIKKLHKMMKKMLKKKIHPDFDADKPFQKDISCKQTKKSEYIDSLNTQGSRALEV